MENKKYQIIFAADSSVEEITDSIADVFGVAYKIEEQLADGFQLTDLLIALQVESAIREVVNDFPVFVAEFQQLSGSTALQAVEAAKARSLAEFGDLGKVGTFIYDFLIQSARTFNFIEATVVQGIGELNQWKALFASVKKPVEQKRVFFHSVGRGRLKQSAPTGTAFTDFEHLEAQQ